MTKRKKILAPWMKKDIKNNLSDKVKSRLDESGEATLSNKKGVTILVEEVVKEVEKIAEEKNVKKAGEDKKKLAKELISSLVFMIPLPSRIFSIPIPKFVIRYVIKQIANYFIDKVVTKYNKSGVFQTSSTPDQTQ